MTSICLIQRASILAGMTIASIPFYSTPVQAEPEFCVVASNGKTVCGTLKTIERACVTNNAGSSVCGKFKSVSEGQAQEPRQEEAKNSTTSAGYQKESDGVVFLLRNCKRSSSDVKCNLVLAAKEDNHRGYIESGKGYSSIVDSAGRTYPSSSLEHNGRNSTSFSESLSPGVDYVVDLNFKNIPGQTTKAALINLSVQNGKVVQFRNVPISN